MKQTLEAVGGQPRPRRAEGARRGLPHLRGRAVIGLVNATAFTATLAARTKYAPPYARAQVFVTSAGLKVALASVGAAATGMAAGLGGRVLLLPAAAITATSVLAAIADRVLDRRRADVKKTPGGAP